MLHNDKQTSFQLKMYMKRLYKPLSFYGLRVSKKTIKSWILISLFQSVLRLGNITNIVITNITNMANI